MAVEKSNTYQRILEESGKLFSQRGYYGVSMRDIAQKVGITKAGLYYYFSGKDELVKVLMKQAVEELEGDLRQIAKDSRVLSDFIFGAVETMIDFKIKHPEITMFANAAMKADQKIPIMEFLSELRKDFLIFLKELIKSLNFIRKGTYTLIFSLVTTLIGVVLAPFHAEHKEPRKLAKDFIKLINSIDE